MCAGSREEETVNWCEYREGVVKYCLKEQVNILGMIVTGEEGTNGQLYCGSLQKQGGWRHLLWSRRE